MEFKSARRVCWDEPVPNVVARAPAQLSSDCRAAYFVAAKEFFSGAGAIIDSGTLAGGSSVALLEGWKAGGRSVPQRPFLHAFDAFRCDENTPLFFHEHFGGDWSAGDNFRTIYERAVQGYADYVEIYEGDIMKFEPWNGPGIEILGIDVWKNESIARHCARIFFPHLMIGSIVLQQDYNHIWLPHIHRIMEALSSHFEKVHETEIGGTIIFQLVRTISNQDVEIALQRQSDCNEGKLLAETAARRAWKSHTELFVEIADCLREAKCAGKDSAFLQLGRVEAKAKHSLLDEEYRKFFADQILQMQVYITGLAYSA